MTGGLFDWFVTLLFGTLGIGLLVAAAVSSLRTLVFVNRAVTTVGVIVDMHEEVEQSGRDAGETFHYPVIRFQTSSGAPIQFQSSINSSSDYSVGEQVTVLYAESCPDEATVKEFTSPWVLSIIMAAFGAVFTISAFVGLVQLTPLRSWINHDLLGALVFGLFGVCLLIAAVSMLLHQRASLKGAATAAGVVEEVVRAPESLGEKTRIPGFLFSHLADVNAAAVVRFKTKTGARIKFDAEPRSTGPGYRMGERVTVVYDPERPDQARVKGSSPLPIFVALMGVIGMVFTALALGLLAKVIQF